MIRELGASNKVFYYNYVGRGTFNMQVIMKLSEPVNKSKLQLAVDRTMPRFPEFAITPVYQNGHLFAEENTQEVVIRREDNKTHYFAENDSNGFLFYFSYDNSILKFSCFHGLTDFKGFMTFLRTVLFEYYLEMGNIFTQNELDKLAGNIRFSESDIPADDGDFWDPYVKYSRNILISENSSIPENAADIHAKQYPDCSGELNFYEIKCSLSSYREKVHLVGATSASLLAAVISSATFNINDIDTSKPVVAMLPVDLRPLFNSHTLVNFSDGIMLSMAVSDTLLPLKDRCQKMYTSMKNSICRDTFEPVMYSKVNQVMAIEHNESNIADTIEHNVTLPAPGSFSPLTYALTYPGSLSMGESLDRFIEDITVHGFARASSVIASSFGDTLRIQIAYRSDDTQWPDAIFNEISNLGLKAEIKSFGKLSGDILKPEAFLP